MARQKAKWVYYIALAFVVVFWGFSSVGYYYFYQHYSAAVLTVIMTLFSAIFFWVLAGKRLKQIDGCYWKIALPICLLYAFSNVLQRIGLQYTTPANYAFFEHLSCVVVPVMMFLFIRKKPTILQIVAGICCLVGCFILCGASFTGQSALGIGDLLCIVAGVLLGICAAAIGAFTKKLDAVLFMVFYMTAYFAVSLLMAVGMNFIQIGGEAMEPAVITWSVPLLLLVIVFGLMDIALCWLLKTEVLRHIDPVTVATVSPFAAAITGIVSVLVGIDRLTPKLVVGGGIIFAAVVVPELVEALRTKMKNTNQNAGGSYE